MTSRHIAQSAGSNPIASDMEAAYHPVVDVSPPRTVMEFDRSSRRVSRAGAARRLAPDPRTGWTLPHRVSAKKSFIAVQLRRSARSSYAAPYSGVSAVGTVNACIAPE